MSGGDRQSGDQPVRLFQKDSLDVDIEGDDDFLGAGSFGSVYRCRLKETSEIVALKIINAPPRLRQSEKKSLMKEARILHHLTGCPNIVRLLGLCITGLYALVMEYFENGDLHTVLILEGDKHPAVKQWDCRTNMALDIAQGMKYLHTLPKPIIHGDLKSGNVLVDKNYCCKISDFGLAKMRDMSVHSHSRQSGGGTLAFTAPEVFMSTSSQEIVDEKAMKTDVYSYSVVLWQLKEMKMPYGGCNPVVIRANVMSGARPPLSNDDCSDGLKNLIIRCWHPQPEVRLSFSEIVTMVEGIKVQTVTPVSSTAPTDDGLSHHNDQPDQSVSEIVTMVEGIKVQTVTPISSTAPTEDDLSHHNDQPDQSVLGKPDEHSSINVSQEPQIDNKAFVDSGPPSGMMPQPSTDQAPAHSKTKLSSFTPTQQSVTVQNLPSDPPQPDIPPSLTSVQNLPSDPPKPDIPPSLITAPPSQASTNSTRSGISPDAGRVLENTPLDQSLVVAGSHTAVKNVPSTSHEQEPRMESEHQSTPCEQESRELPATPSKQKPCRVESELTDLQLQQVAEKVGRYWQEIGLHLGSTFQQLEECKTAHRDSMKDRLCQILCAWRMKEGKDATAAALVKACTKARAGGAVKTLFGIK